MTNKTEWEATQADRDLVADILDAVSSLGTGHVADRIRDARYDEHECVRIAVDHRIEATTALEAERDALRAVLKSLARWFDADDEVLDAMSQDELADHNRQVDKISKALAISEKSE